MHINNNNNNNHNHNSKNNSCNNGKDKSRQKSGYGCWQFMTESLSINEEMYTQSRVHTIILMLRHLV